MGETGVGEVCRAIALEGKKVSKWRPGRSTPSDQSA